uniref:Uncharacterized protein n=1 Tax=Octopus bimaculoides TaxID=37653 RepID=A0A0L8HN22_OCTBM
MQSSLILLDRAIKTNTRFSIDDNIRGTDRMDSSISSEFLHFDSNTCRGTGTKQRESAVFSFKFLPSLYIYAQMQVQLWLGMSYIDPYVTICFKLFAVQLCYFGFNYFVWHFWQGFQHCHRSTST